MELNIFNDYDYSKVKTNINTYGLSISVNIPVSQKRRFGVKHIYSRTGKNNAFNMYGWGFQLSVPLDIKNLKDTGSE